MKFTNFAYTVSLLIVVLGFAGGGCGSSVGQPAKFQTKEEVEKHVIGIYQRVYESPSEQEAANIQNDLSRPEGVSPGKHSTFYSILPNGKTFWWSFNDRLRLVTLSNYPFEDMGSYSIEKRSGGSWILSISSVGDYVVCDNGLEWTGQNETNAYVKMSSTAFSTKAEVFNYHGVTLPQ
jgi:hypothetical protein